MRIIHTKIITILIVGVMFAIGFIMSFNSYVFAGDPVYVSVKEVDKASPKLHKTKTTEPVGADIQITAKKVIKFKAGADLANTMKRIKRQKIEFHDSQINIIRNIKSATLEDRNSLIDQLRTNRGSFQAEIISMNLKIRENAKELRENFRERAETAIGRADHGKIARIAVAHGKGLRVLNRFRSAIARFDHILKRIESRADKLEARGVDTSSAIQLIEEAKNMSIGNEAKMEELKAKYESLLLGENPYGIAGEARVTAKELKSEIENLNAKLRDIINEIKLIAANFNSSRSNKSNN